MRLRARFPALSASALLKLLGTSLTGSMVPTGPLLILSAFPFGKWASPSIRRVTPCLLTALSLQAETRQTFNLNSPRTGPSSHTHARSVAALLVATSLASTRLKVATSRKPSRLFKVSAFNASSKICETNVTIEQKTPQPTPFDAARANDTSKAIGSALAACMSSDWNRMEQELRNALAMIQPATEPESGATNYPSYLNREMPDYYLTSLGDAQIRIRRNRDLVAIDLAEALAHMDALRNYRVPIPTPEETAKLRAEIAEWHRCEVAKEATKHQQYQPGCLGFACDTEDERLWARATTNTLKIAYDDFKLVVDYARCGSLDALVPALRGVVVPLANMLTAFEQEIAKPPKERSLKSVTFKRVNLKLSINAPKEPKADTPKRTRASKPSALRASNHTVPPTRPPFAPISLEDLKFEPEDGFAIRVR
ncbi:hypothetical protein U91I_02791 [alpha proteobacterium U9-1i]|nr:hypothetical protein U91I_02791 [alpha proteobacterium U9-1i]